MHAVGLFQTMWSPSILRGCGYAFFMLDVIFHFKQPTTTRVVTSVGLVWSRGGLNQKQDQEVR
jgi:hypothetical protein